MACMTIGSMAGVRIARACDVPVAEDPKLGDAWHAAIGDLRAQLAARDDCASLTLAIVHDEGGARVIATDPAGVRAERHVARPSDLRAIVRGIVASLPSERKREPRPEAPSAAEAPAELPPTEPPAPPPTPIAPRSAWVWASFGVGARVGVPTRVAAWDMELRVDAQVHDWLVSGFVRYAPLGAYIGTRAIPNFEYDEVAFGAAAGKRLDFGGASVDFSLGPEIVVMSEEGDVPADGIGGGDDELRIVGCARLMIGRGPWRPMLAVDGEIAPFAAFHPAVAAPTLPSLPTWTVGLRVGVARDLL